jgi:RNA polymerase primary sigma factor
MTDYLDKHASLPLLDPFREHNGDAAGELLRATADAEPFQADPEQDVRLGEFDYPTEGPAGHVTHQQDAISDRALHQKEISHVRKPSRVGSAGRRDSAVLSPDLLDTYFRQMGNIDLLSREDEVALAQRIEASQLAVLEGLCRVPLLIDRIQQWVAELRRGERHLRDLIDLSVGEGEPSSLGFEGEAPPGEFPSTLGDADDPALEVEEPEAASTGDRGADSPSGGREAGPRAETFARLEGICVLAQQIVSLSQKRMAALARGREPAMRNRTRLEDLLAQAGREMAHVRLHPDRISELAALLEHEQQQLRRIERELLVLAESCRVAPRDPHDRHGSLGHIIKGGCFSDSSWQTLAHHDAVRVTELREELSAIARRVGLPISELRNIAQQVSQARRDVKGAREAIVRAYLPLVVSVAMKYRGKSSLDTLDLIQEGNLGLMRAVEKYDYRRGVKVATYAVWWIRQAITRAMADRGRMIRVPVHMAGTANRVLRERRKLYQKQGREPRADEIAAHAAIPIDRVEKAMSLVREPTSLDIPIGEDGDATLADLIEAPDAASPLAAMEASALKDHVAEALARLTPREERILRMRFGIGDMTEHTLDEVGKVFGVTRERIRQIEAKALDKLRHPSRGRKLSTFADD